MNKILLKIFGTDQISLTHFKRSYNSNLLIIMSLTNKVYKTSKIDASIKVNNDEMLNSNTLRDNSEKLKIVRATSPKKHFAKDSAKLMKRKH